MENKCECRCQGGLLYKLNKYAEVHRELNLENALLEIKQLAALKKDMHIVNLVEKTLKEDN